MADRGLARLLRTREAAFRKAHEFLVLGFDRTSCKLRSVREILAIARDWRFHSAMESEFPRRAAIRELIQNVEADNQRLMNSLLRLSESLELSSYFLLPSAVAREKDKAFGLYADMGIRGANASPKLNTSPLYERLVRLGEFCAVALGNRVGEGTESSWLGSDAGGQTNIYKEYTGSAKWQLVYRSALVFANYQPTRFASTIGGPFHQFCAAMLEFATGESDPDERAGLRRHIDFAVPSVRRVSEIGAELRRDLSPEVRETLENERATLTRELRPGPKKPAARSPG